jgi:hypothetical protein
MRLTPLILATIVVLVASLAGQWMGASSDSVGFSVFAAMAFIGALLRTGWQVNRAWWQASAQQDIGPSGANSELAMAQTNAGLLALGYAWGGLSLLTVYGLTTLRWQHGWQYGLGMFVIALLIYVLSRQMTAKWSPQVADLLTWCTIAQSSAATAALAWFVGTGKLVSSRSDWAANIVFAGGGVAIVFLSVMAVRTARALRST